MGMNHGVIVMSRGQRPVFIHSPLRGGLRASTRGLDLVLLNYFSLPVLFNLGVNSLAFSRFFH